MKIRLLAVGTGMPEWVETGYRDYAKRLCRDVQLELVEIPAGHRGKSADVQRLTEREGEALLGAVREGDRLLAMDVRGKIWSTEQLSTQMQLWLMSGQNICLAIGGPEGLSPRVLEAAQERWSLSPLTLPHPLVRVILAEQLYRAWTLIHGHPYHR